MSIELVMSSNHLILCHPLRLLPLIFPSFRVFSNESALRIRRPKYWSFSFSVSPSNECSVLISFMIDWLDLFAVQETLKSLLQHHSSKAWILRHPAFFMVQLSYLYMTARKTIDLTIYTFVGKVMSLLFNILSRFVISFLPKSKRLNFVTAGTICSDSGAQENEIQHRFHWLHIYLHEMMGLDAIIFIFWMLSFNQLFHSPLSPSSRDTLVSLHFLPLNWYHVHMWGCWYFSQQSWFQLVSHPAQHFVWMYSAYKLNKQSDNIQPWQYSFLSFEPVHCSIQF